MKHTTKHSSTQPAPDLPGASVASSLDVVGTDPPALVEQHLNRLIDIYPANNVYTIHLPQIRPCRKLNRRFRAIHNLYPQNLHSLLDVGCAQGGFVLDAALRWPDARLVGIDVLPRYTDLCQQVAQHLRLKNTRFFMGHLHQFADRLADFEGPFQVVLLLNLYHYLYFGSQINPEGYRDHHRIFALLNDLCTESLILSAPLDLKACPRYLQAKKDAHLYNEQAILSAARTFFHVEHIRNLGKRPLLLLRPLSAPKPPAAT